MSGMFFRLMKFRPWQRIFQFPQAASVGNVVAGDGSSSGAATVGGTADAIWAVAGNASGVGAASDPGDGIWAVVGTASGTGSASAVGDEIGADVGGAAGVGAAAGVGVALTQAAGTSSGASDAAAIGDAISTSAGSSAGVASVEGVGADANAQTIVASAGEAIGSCMVRGVGFTLAPIAAGGSFGRSPRPAKKAPQVRPFRIVGGTGVARGASTAVADRRAQLRLVSAPVVVEAAGQAAGSCQVLGVSEPWTITEQEEVELLMVIDLLSEPLTNTEQVDVELLMVIDQLMAA